MICCWMYIYERLVLFTWVYLNGLGEWRKGTASSWETSVAAESAKNYAEFSYSLANSWKRNVADFDIIWRATQLIPDSCTMLICQVFNNFTQLLAFCPKIVHISHLVARSTLWSLVCRFGKKSLWKKKDDGIIIDLSSEYYVLYDWM